MKLRILTAGLVLGLSSLAFFLGTGPVWP